MRAALSIVLAGLLVTTPLKMVLAQAEQQKPLAYSKPRRRTVAVTGS